MRVGGTREVQDSARQRLILEHCGLRGIEGRMALADATDRRGNLYELKSATKRGVTTARDVGLHTVDRWRRKYWIIAIGRNLEGGFQIGALYIAHPDDLESFFGQIQDRLEADWKTCSAVLKAAQASGMEGGVLDRVREICRRGITINNPKIPLACVEENATQISHDRPRVARRQIGAFVRARPLRAAEQR
jgi:hypothetical protein